MKEKSIKNQCHDESMVQKFSSDPNYLASLTEAVMLDGAGVRLEFCVAKSKLRCEYVLQKGANSGSGSYPRKVWATS